jgi:hypothetical protein
MSRVDAKMSMSSQASGQEHKKPAERDNAKVFNKHIWPHFKLLFNKDDMEKDSPIAQTYLQQMKGSSAINRTAQSQLAKKM